MKQWVKYGLYVRLVDESDAEFILGLRQDERLSRYLTKTSLDIADQLKWIRDYKEREKKKEEYYFIYEDGEGNRLGVSRVYDFDGDSFESGSWVFRQGLELSIPVMGDLACRDFGFEELGFAYCRFEAMRGNERVIRYQKAFHPDLVGEDERAYYFRMSYETYKVHRDKLLKLFFHG